MSDNRDSYLWTTLQFAKGFHICYPTSSMRDAGEDAGLWISEPYCTKDGKKGLWGWGSGRPGWLRLARGVGLDSYKGHYSFCLPTSHVSFCEQTPCPPSEYPVSPKNIALGLSRIVSHGVHSRGLQMTPDLWKSIQVLTLSGIWILVRNTARKGHSENPWLWLWRSQLSLWASWVSVRFCEYVQDIAHVPEILFISGKKTPEFYRYCIESLGQHGGVLLFE